MLVWILPACVLMFVFLYLWTRIPSKSWRFQQSGHSRAWGSPDTLNQGGWVLPWPHGPSVGQEQPREAPGRCSAEQSSCRHEGKIWAVLTLCQTDPYEVSKSSQVPFEDMVTSVTAAFCSPELLNWFYSDPVSCFIKVCSGESRALVLAVLDQVVL